MDEAVLGCILPRGEEAVRGVDRLPNIVQIGRTNAALSSLNANARVAGDVGNLATFRLRPVVVLKAVALDLDSEDVRNRGTVAVSENGGVLGGDDHGRRGARNDTRRETVGQTGRKGGSDLHALDDAVDVGSLIHVDAELTDDGRVEHVVRGALLALGGVNGAPGGVRAETTSDAQAELVALVVVGVVAGQGQSLSLARLEPDTVGEASGANDDDGDRHGRSAGVRVGERNVVGGQFRDGGGGAGDGASQGGVAETGRESGVDRDGLDDAGVGGNDVDDGAHLGVDGQGGVLDVERSLLRAGASDLSPLGRRVGFHDAAVASSEALVVLSVLTRGVGVTVHDCRSPYAVLKAVVPEDGDGEDHGLGLVVAVLEDEVELLTREHGGGRSRDGAGDGEGEAGRERGVDDDVLHETRVGRGDHDGLTHVGDDLGLGEGNVVGGALLALGGVDVAPVGREAAAAIDAGTGLEALVDARVVAGLGGGLALGGLRPAALSAADGRDDGDGDADGRGGAVAVLEDEGVVHARGGLGADAADLAGEVVEDQAVGQRRRNHDVLDDVLEGGRHEDGLAESHRDCGGGVEDVGGGLLSALGTVDGAEVGGCAVQTDAGLLAVVVALLVARLAGGLTDLGVGPVVVVANGIHDVDDDRHEGGAAGVDGGDAEGVLALTVGRAGDGAGGGVEAEARRQHGGDGPGVHLTHVAGGDGVHLEVLGDGDDGGVGDAVGVAEKAGGGVGHAPDAQRAEAGLVALVDVGGGAGDRSHLTGGRGGPGKLGGAVRCDHSEGEDGGARLAAGVGGGDDVLVHGADHRGSAGDAAGGGVEDQTGGETRLDGEAGIDDVGDLGHDGGDGLADEEAVGGGLVGDHGGAHLAVVGHVAPVSLALAHEAGSAQGALVVDGVGAVDGDGATDRDGAPGPLGGAAVGVDHEEEGGGAAASGVGDGDGVLGARAQLGWLAGEDAGADVEGDASGEGRGDREDLREAGGDGDDGRHRQVLEGRVGGGGVADGGHGEGAEVLLLPVDAVVASSLVVALVVGGTALSAEVAVKNSGIAVDGKAGVVQTSGEQLELGQLEIVSRAGLDPVDLRVVHLGDGESVVLVGHGVGNVVGLRLLERGEVLAGGGVEERVLDVVVAALEVPATGVSLVAVVGADDRVAVDDLTAVRVDPGELVADARGAAAELGVGTVIEELVGTLVASEDLVGPEGALDDSVGVVENHRHEDAELRGGVIRLAPVVLEGEDVLAGDDGVELDREGNRVLGPLGVLRLAEGGGGDAVSGKVLAIDLLSIHIGDEAAEGVDVDLVVGVEVQIYSLEGEAEEDGRRIQGGNASQRGGGPLAVVEGEGGPLGVRDLGLGVLPDGVQGVDDVTNVDAHSEGGGAGADGSRGQHGAVLKKDSVGAAAPSVVGSVVQHEAVDGRGAAVGVDAGEVGDDRGSGVDELGGGLSVELKAGLVALLLEDELEGEQGVGVVAGGHRDGEGGRLLHVEVVQRSDGVHSTGHDLGSGAHDLAVTVVEGQAGGQRRRDGEMVVVKGADREGGEGLVPVRLNDVGRVGEVGDGKVLQVLEEELQLGEGKGVGLAVLTRVGELELVVRGGLVAVHKEEALPLASAVEEDVGLARDEGEAVAVVMADVDVPVARVVLGGVEVGGEAVLVDVLGAIEEGDLDGAGLIHGNVGDVSGVLIVVKEVGGVTVVSVTVVRGHDVPGS